MWVVLFLISCGSLLVNGYGNDDILGKGRWLVLNNMQCDDSENYEIPVDVSRRKINRTHDAFTFNATLEKDIDTTYGLPHGLQLERPPIPIPAKNDTVEAMEEAILNISFLYFFMDDLYNSKTVIEIIADKEVDGGFKFYQTITDQSICDMLKKYTGENFPRVLTMAKVDPPDCPIPKGKIEIEDYVLDYRELQETGMYGTFDASVYLTYAAQRVACMRWLVRFERTEDDEDDDDDDY